MKFSLAAVTAAVVAFKVLSGIGVVEGQERHVRSGGGGSTSTIFSNKHGTHPKPSLLSSSAPTSGPTALPTNSSSEPTDSTLVPTLVPTEEVTLGAPVEENPTDAPTEGEVGAPVEETNGVLVGAGVASGVIGILLGGPFLALYLGFGAAIAAEQHEGALGDAARAVGEVALAVGAKAREIDNKHHVVEHVKVALTIALEKAEELNQKHRIMEKATDMIVLAWNKYTEFVTRHGLLERGRVVFMDLAKACGDLLKQVHESIHPPCEHNHRKLTKKKSPKEV